MAKKTATTGIPMPTELMEQEGILDLATAEILTLPNGVQMIVKPLTAGDFWDLQRNAMEGADQIAGLQTLIIKMFAFIDPESKEVTPVTLMDLDAGEGADTKIGFKGCAFLSTRLANEFPGAAEKLKQLQQPKS